MKRLLVASYNAGKVREIAQLLAGWPLEVLGLQDMSLEIELPEPYATFAENACSKAQAAAAQAGCWALADDSGLVVPALGGRPGAYSSRYGATDAERIARLLQEMQGLPPERRKAHFVCVLALADPQRVLGFWEGTCAGAIAEAPRGAAGFGYDPVFVYQGRTFAEMTAEEKNRVSHRGQALRSFLRDLPRLLDERA